MFIKCDQLVQIEVLTNKNCLTNKKCFFKFYLVKFDLNYLFMFYYDRFD